ncbi:MAG: ATP-dependent metallopeptidase FtsH/Yme1/Tma family protein [Olsenella sp.]|nr:ATP-dependent metallopeptidase FtsH/Yme1/Tma family protein [Olsenella sp.]
MADNNNPNRNDLLGGPKGDPGRRRQAAIVTLILVALIAYGVYSAAQGVMGSDSTKTLATSDFVAAVKSDEVSEVTYKTSDGSLRGKMSSDGTSTSFVS